ncbi:MAG: GNAT family N-acetyltransferase [Peptococcaceae bacterium]|nr:GNAT family N-acetyltransferase [Peptococcaceae bacterium]
MNTIIYRKSELKDVNRMIELRVQQLLEEGEIVTSDLAGPLYDYYVRHFRDKTFISWLAIDNDISVATGGISIVEKPPYYSNPTGRIAILSSMYTLKPYRRKGIAKKILGFIVNEAKDRDCGLVQLTASDTGALLYQDFGFEKRHNCYQYRCDKTHS